MERSRLFTLCRSGGAAWRDVVIGHILPDGPIEAGQGLDVGLTGLAAEIIAGYPKEDQSYQISKLTRAEVLDQLPQSRATWRMAIANNANTGTETLARLAATALRKEHWGCLRAIATHANVTDEIRSTMLPMARSGVLYGTTAEKTAIAEDLWALAVGSDELVAFLSRQDAMRRGELIKLIGRHRPAFIEENLEEIVGLAISQSRSTDYGRSVSSDDLALQGIAQLPSPSVAMFNALGPAGFRELVRARGRLYELPIWQLNSELAEVIATQAPDDWYQIAHDFDFSRELLLEVAARPMPTRPCYSYAVSAWFRRAENLRCFPEVVMHLARSGALSGPMALHLGQVNAATVEEHPDLVFSLLAVESCRRGSLLGNFTTKDTLVAVAEELADRSEIIALVSVVVRRRAAELSFDLLNELGVADVVARTELVGLLGWLSAAWVPLFLDVPGTLRGERLMLPLIGDIISEHLAPEEFPTAFELLANWEGSANDLLATIKSVRS